MSRGKNETPESQVQFSDFPGLFLLSDPVDLPPGASQDQVNIKSDLAGSMQVRGGCQVIQFDYSA